MNPEQPAPLPPSPGNNYDFIVNPARPGKTRGTGTGRFSNPLVLRVVFVVVVAVVLLFGATIASKLLFSDKTRVDDLVRLTQTQTEVVRIGEMGDQSGDQTMRNVAVNTRLVLLTQRQELTAFLAKHGRKVDAKELVAKKNKQTDTRLTRAKQTSTFDPVYEDVMKELLTAYATSIKTAHSQAYGITEKKLLTKHYEQTQALLGQLPK